MKKLLILILLFFLVFCRSSANNPNFIETDVIQVIINGEKANFTNNYKYRANTNQLEIFAQEFENYSNGEDSKYKYTENFVVSFWVKANKDITGDAKAKLYVKKVKDRLILNDIVDEIYQNVYIAHAKANSWQYVTIPVNLGQEQYNLGEISISFSGISSDTIIEVADMRIAVGNSTSVILYDNSDIDNSIDLSSVTNFNLVHMDINRTVKNEFTATVNNQTITVPADAKIYYNTSYSGVEQIGFNSTSTGILGSSFETYKHYIIYVEQSLGGMQNYVNYPITIGNIKFN
jgi:hypothetical protein